MANIAILGGGASALMCACFAHKNNKVTIFEKNEKVGKKILATGNGKCNLTNLNVSSSAYNQNIDKYLQVFDNKKTIEFFNNLGLETYADEMGRVYPFSNSAISVVDVLKNHLMAQKNITFNTEKIFVDLQKINDKYKVIFDDNSYEFFDKIIVALGNYADLKIFDKFNIKYKKFTPSLCAMRSKIDKRLAGLRVSDVMVYCKGKAFDFKEKGEILFRQDGISGIVIFNLSAYLARHNLPRAEVVIDLLPNVNINQLKNKLKLRQKQFFNYNASEFLTGFFHKSLNYVLLKNSQINQDILVKDISDREINNLCKQIKKFTIQTTDFLDNNQVCSGGILLDELTPNLESKVQKNLYFIGEIVDVDGVCGGFNLQWAWTSGYIVGNEV